MNLDRLIAGICTVVGLALLFVVIGAIIATVANAHPGDIERCKTVYAQTDQILVCN